MAFGPIPSSGGAHTVGSTAQTLSDASVTVPAAATWGEGYVRSNPIVKSNGGFTPSATLGTQYNVGDIVILRSPAEIAQAVFIRQGGTDGTIDWDWFTGQP